MITTIRKQFAKHPQRRRRQLYACLWFGLVVWTLGFGSLVWGLFAPGRSLGMRLVSGFCVIFVLGVTGAFVWVFWRLDRRGAWDDYLDST